VHDDIKPLCHYETHACNCKRPYNPMEMGCGEDCINRLIYTECNPATCPCGEQCNNQKIQKHEWAPGLKKFLTDDRGCGIKTTESLQSGELLLLGKKQRSHRRI